jgi:hypothetical protein
VIAHLLEPGQQGEDVHVGDLAGRVAEHRCDLRRLLGMDGPVQGMLLLGEPAVAEVLHLVGKVCQYLLLDAPQGQRRQSLPQPMQLVVSGGAIGRSEFSLRAQVAGQDEVHHRPQLEQAVLERRAGESDPEPRLHLACRPGRLGAGVLDPLRLVEDRHLPAAIAELVGRAQQQVVGREHELAAAVQPLESA